jgi:hypothetical protein
VHWGCDYATSLKIEVDPQRRRVGRRESDFALQRMVDCRRLYRNESDWFRCDDIPVAVKCASVSPVGLWKKKTQKIAVPVPVPVPVTVQKTFQSHG